MIVSCRWCDLVHTENVSTFIIFSIYLACCLNVNNAHIWPVSHVFNTHQIKSALIAAEATAY